MTNCESAFPKTFQEVKKTIENIRKQKYGKPPTNCEEIKTEFEKPEIFENLGLPVEFSNDHYLFMCNMETKHFPLFTPQCLVKRQMPILIYFNMCTNI